MHGKNNFLDGNPANKYGKLVRIYSVLMHDLAAAAKISGLDVTRLVKRIGSLVKYWKLDLKMATLTKAQKMLLPYYLAHKGWMSCLLILKGHRIRRIMKSFMQNIEKAAAAMLSIVLKKSAS